MTPDPTAQKAALRRAHLRRRRERSAGEVEAAGHALAAHVLGLLGEGAAAPGRTPVAGYAALPGEPPTGPLLAALAARGVPALLPVLLPDGDLDWGAVAGADDALRPGRAGTLSPGGPHLGVDAVASVSAVVVPGVAADPSGARLGRGGGSYDRALRRVPPGVPTLLLLYDDEVVDAVPVEPHDRRVSHVVTPRRVVVAHGMAGGLD